MVTDSTRYRIVECPLYLRGRSDIRGRVEDLLSHHPLISEQRLSSLLLLPAVIIAQ